MSLNISSQHNIVIGREAFNTMEESVLRQYSSKLNTLLRTSDTTRNAFSNSLFSDSLLSKDAKHMIETKDGMSAANVLMTELQLKVQNCPSKLQPVIDLMKREIQLEDIAKQMHMELLKHKGEVCEDSMPRPVSETEPLSCHSFNIRMLFYRMMIFLKGIYCHVQLLIIKH